MADDRVALTVRVTPDRYARFKARLARDRRSVQDVLDTAVGDYAEGDREREVARVLARQAADDPDYYAGMFDVEQWAALLRLAGEREVSELRRTLGD